MPSRINTAEPTAALIRAFRLQGDYRPAMDETVSPVVVIGRLDGGPSSLWPRNLSADWRGATVATRPSTSPAIWWRFRDLSGSGKAARVVRIRIAPDNAAFSLLVFRGDLQPILGGSSVTLIPGVWTDDVATDALPNANPRSSFGLQRIGNNDTNAPLTYSGVPVAAVRCPGATFDHSLYVNLDIPAGGSLSLVPWLVGAGLGETNYRFEAVAAIPTLSVDFLEEY